MHSLGWHEICGGFEINWTQLDMYIKLHCMLQINHERHNAEICSKIALALKYWNFQRSRAGSENNAFLHISPATPSMSFGWTIMNTKIEFAAIQFQISAGLEGLIGWHFTSQVWSISSKNSHILASYVNFPSGCWYVLGFDLVAFAKTATEGIYWMETKMRTAKYK